MSLQGIFKSIPMSSPCNGNACREWTWFKPLFYSIFNILFVVFGSPLLSPFSFLNSFFPYLLFLLFLGDQDLACLFVIFSNQVRSAPNEELCFVLIVFPFQKTILFINSNTVIIMGSVYFLKQSKVLKREKKVDSFHCFFFLIN